MLLGRMTQSAERTCTCRQQPVPLGAEHLAQKVASAPCKIAFFGQKNIKKVRKKARLLASERRGAYFCNVFHGIRFKVSKIGCRETINFFLFLPVSSPV